MHFCIYRPIHVAYLAINQKSLPDRQHAASLLLPFLSLDYTGHLCVRRGHRVLFAGPTSGPCGERWEHGHCVPGPHGSPGAT